MAHRHSKVHFVKVFSVIYVSIGLKYTSYYGLWSKKFERQHLERLEIKSERRHDMGMRPLF